MYDMHIQSSTQPKMFVAQALCHQMIFQTGPLGTEELEAVGGWCAYVQDLTFDLETRHFSG